MIHVYAALAGVLDVVIHAARRVRRAAVIRAARHSSEFWRLQ